jgi:hypothetical protein
VASFVVPGAPTSTSNTGMADAGGNAPPDAAHAALQLLQALAASPQMGGQGIDIGSASAMLAALAGQVRVVGGRRASGPAAGGRRRALPRCSWR